MKIIFKPTQALWKRRERLKNKSHYRMIQRIFPLARNRSNFPEVTFTVGVLGVTMRSPTRRQKLQMLLQLREEYQLLTGGVDWRPEEMIAEDYYSV